VGDGGQRGSDIERRELRITELMEGLGVVSVDEVVSCGRLRWYRHMLHVKIRVTEYWQLQFEGTKIKGRD